MSTLLWVMLGGALGTGARYSLVNLLQSSPLEGFPYGTLAVNLAGCLLIGLIAAFFVHSPGPASYIKPALIIGLLGGFTTFSSFGFEALTLLRNGSVGLAGTYIIASNVGGIALAWGGYTLAR